MQGQAAGFGPLWLLVGLCCGGADGPTGHLSIPAQQDFKIVIFVQTSCPGFLNSSIIQLLRWESNVRSEAHGHEEAAGAGALLVGRRGSTVQGSRGPEVWRSREVWAVS